MLLRCCAFLCIASGLASARKALGSGGGAGGGPNMGPFVLEIDPAHPGKLYAKPALPADTIKGLNALDNAASNAQLPGPNRAFRLIFPSVPAAGNVNAAGFR